MVRLDVDSQIARQKRHEDKIPARRQDARTLLACARELQAQIEDGDVMYLPDLWRKRARAIEDDGDRVPGFLTDEEG